MSVPVWNKEEKGIVWVLAVKGIRNYINYYNKNCKSHDDWVEFFSQKPVILGIPE